MSKQNEVPIENYDSILGLFVRIFWMLLGNAILFFAALSIFQHKGEILHTADIVYWATTAALVIARYLDIKFWKGLTATGQPATMSHWRKYTVILLVCLTAVWAALHTINYFIVNK
jgi:hypothetical protein